MNAKNHMESILTKIKVEKIKVKRIEFEYRGSKDICLHRCHGDAGASLSPAYFKRIENNFISLESQLLNFFSSLARENLKVIVPVNDRGDFDLESLQIEISTTIKLHNGLVNKVKRLSKSCMVYAELLHELRIFGNQGELTHVTAFLVANIDDLLYISENPIVHPSLNTDWAHVLRKAQDESRRTYNYERILPCIDGMLEWDTAEICLQIHQQGYLSTKGGIAR